MRNIKKIIEALETEIECGNCPHNEGECQNGDCYFVSAAKALERQLWIPIEQCTPKGDGMYNVTFDDGFVTSAEWVHGDWELWADAGEVVAWMPLPEPYKTEAVHEQ